MTITLNPIKRHRNQCRETRADISEFLDGELDRQTAARVKRHVRWCPNCHRLLTNVSRTIGGLRALRDVPPAADDSVHPKPGS